MKSIIQQFITIGSLSHKRNLMTDTGGNISVRADNLIYITKTGIRLDSLTNDDIITSNINDAPDPLASKEYDMHRSIYRMRQDVTAILHLHPPYSIACGDINFLQLAQTVGVRCDYAPFSAAGSKKLATDTTNVLANKEINIVSQLNHGILSVGKNLQQAFDIAELYEHLAKVTYLRKTL